MFRQNSHKFINDFCHFSLSVVHFRYALIYKFSLFIHLSFEDGDLCLCFPYDLGNLIPIFTRSSFDIRHSVTVVIYQSTLHADTDLTIFTIVLERFALVIFLGTHRRSMHQFFDILYPQFLEQNTPVTSRSLQALMCVKTSCTEKALTNKTIRSNNAAIVAAIACLHVCIAIMNSKDIHQSIEMKGCGKIRKGITFWNVEFSQANRTF